MRVGYYAQVGGSFEWLANYPESLNLHNVLKKHPTALVYQYTAYGKWMLRVKSGHWRNTTEPNIVKMMKLIGAI